MNASDIEAAKGRMNAAELELLEQLSAGKTPIEAVRLLEFFHYFPGCRMETSPRREPEFEDDALGTRERWEVWNDQVLGT